jgi:hypothetical protein
MEAINHAQQDTVAFQNALPWYCHLCMQFITNCDWNKTTKSKSLWNYYCEGVWIP